MLSRQRQAAPPSRWLWGGCAVPIAVRPAMLLHKSYDCDRRGLGEEPECARTTFAGGVACSFCAKPIGGHNT